MPRILYHLRPLFAVWLGLGLAPEAGAADFSDPTWPCVQRKVEQLSLGLMWPRVVDTDAALPDGVEADIDVLSQTLALRRVALDEVAPAVAAFAEAHDGNPDYLGQVFARVFDSLSTRRSRIIGGSGDFSLGQIALAEKIDAMRLEMDTELDAEKPDYDRLDVLEERLDWDQVIYSDRQRSITYLCETPVLLERRLFGIAQMLQAVARDDG